jgi:hypothetical protein
MASLRATDAPKFRALLDLYKNFTPGTDVIMQFASHRVSKEDACAFQAGLPLDHPPAYGIPEIPGAFAQVRGTSYDASIEPLLRYAALRLYPPFRTRIRRGTETWDAEYAWAWTVSRPLASMTDDEQLARRLGSKRVEYLQSFPAQTMLLTAEGNVYPVVLLPAPTLRKPG